MNLITIVCIAGGSLWIVVAPIVYGYLETRDGADDVNIAIAFFWPLCVPMKLLSKIGISIGKRAEHKEHTLFLGKRFAERALKETPPQLPPHQDPYDSEEDFASDRVRVPE